MFNNPFDSFHNTVGKAKDDREQLDQLLTISTPRERSLVAAIALVLLAASLWFFFGNISREYAVSGVLSNFDDDLVIDRDTVQALVWIDKSVATKVKSGMSATLELSIPDTGPDEFDGTVSRLDEVSYPHQPELVDSVPPASLYRIGIALDNELGFESNIGQECRIIIELGRQTPLALISGRRS